MLQKPLVIIPAAGFGTRVGSPNSKEILLNPDGRPLIETCLNQAKARQWPVHIITRKEKTSLIAYLEDYQRKESLDLYLQFIEPSREWPDSVLQSKSFWRKRNLLCLPDTIFSPASIWDELVSSSAPLSAAVFEPLDFQNWGVLRKTQNGCEICEKPEIIKPNMKAWGLLSFTPEAGEVLLAAQLESTFHHQWLSLQWEIDFFELDFFKDLTRL